MGIFDDAMDDEQRRREQEREEAARQAAEAVQHTIANRQACEQLIAEFVRTMRQRGISVRPYVYTPRNRNRNYGNGRITSPPGWLLQEPTEDSGYDVPGRPGWLISDSGDLLVGTAGAVSSRSWFHDYKYACDWKRADPGSLNHETLQGMMLLYVKSC